MNKWKIKEREEIVGDYFHNMKFLQILYLSTLNKGYGFLIISLVLKITITLKNYYFGNPQAKPMYFGFEVQKSQNFKLFSLIDTMIAISPGGCDFSLSGIGGDDIVLGIIWDAYTWH